MHNKAEHPLPVLADSGIRKLIPIRLQSDT